MKRKEEMEALYSKYYVDRKFERLEVFQELKTTFGIKSALYPGSFIHITPSFVIPVTAYVDSDKGAKRFFEDMTLVRQMIETRKQYNNDSIIEFIGQSYNSPLPFERESFDLLFSHYAGIISQPCKKYLKKGGHLLVNNSHADAGVAYLDDDYRLIAVIDPNKKNVISTSDLENYFIPKKNAKVTMSDLIKSGTGIGYTRTASLYLFERVS